MSATALAISPDGSRIILLSDGMAMMDGDVYSLHNSKIHLVSDRTAVVWLGIGWREIGEALAMHWNHHQLKEPSAIASATACYLKYAFTNVETLRERVKKKPFWVLVVGYTAAGSIEAFRFYSHDKYKLKPDRFEPIPEKLKAGQLGAMTYMRDASQTSFQRLFATKYWPLYRPDLKHAAKQAFTEMVNDYAGQGHRVGGQVFVETLRNPAS